MKPGMLTVCMEKEDLSRVIDVAHGAGAHYLEIGVRTGSHDFDPRTATDEYIDKLRERLDAAELTVSSLAIYDAGWVLEENRDSGVELARKTIDATVKLGCSTMCMLAGFPIPGKSKIETIKEDLPEAFRPILDYASEHGVVIALENWFRTCLQGIDTFECLFESITDRNLGLNYDPSHLYHQEIDYIDPVRQFRDKIFHVHAKDCVVDTAKKHHAGILSDGWWRYAIPGFGGIDWGNFVSALREIGYDGTLSIEHEDSYQTAEDGVRRGVTFLNQFC